MWARRASDIWLAAAENGSGACIAVLDGAWADVPLSFISMVVSSRTGIESERDMYEERGESDIWANACFFAYFKTVVHSDTKRSLSTSEGLGIALRSAIIVSARADEMGNIMVRALLVYLAEITRLLRNPLNTGAGSFALVSIIIAKF